MLRRIPPLFPPYTWNVTKSPLMANNALTISVGQWNHRLEHLCGVSCPSVWKLIHWLKVDASQVSTTLLNAARGEHPRKRVKRVYTQLH
ncbi:hypothetical protein LSH36_8g08026 [Paralvinella palmiformis]|uniref:Uncharacterized protein n=1 Tax=Paralvinella palmiformis TaxID=53620 RepID=A0AAD9NGP8_9ANNE|nr:hypothetical protein LSH36_8g08026 [Paralvinella palmiformis]